MESIQIHPYDNVEVLLKPHGDVPAGHKLALRDIKAGEKIVKYGFPIGVATKDIAKGEWVHVHNVRTALGEESDYRYEPAPGLGRAVAPGDVPTFGGYLRADGRAGIRNEIWIVPTVGCVNATATKLAADNQELVGGAVEGLYAFTHPYGCSQTGADHAQTRKLLAALCRQSLRHGAADAHAGAGDDGDFSLQIIAHKSYLQFLI